VGILCTVLFAALVVAHHACMRKRGSTTST